MTQSDDDSERMQRLMMALADQVEAATDAQVLDDAVAAGIDVNRVAGNVRAKLLEGVLAAKKARLHKAQREHAASIARAELGPSKIPTDAGARKAMLDNILQRRPNMREAVVTLQHREFDSFSDADVESVLRQLEALGALEEDEQKPK